MGIAFKKGGRIFTDPPGNMAGLPENPLSARLTAIEAAINDLRSGETTLAVKVATGDTAVTDIPVAGILAGAVIVGVVDLTSLADVSELPAATSDGNVQFPTLDTTGKKLLVVYGGP